MRDRKSKRTFEFRIRAITKLTLVSMIAFPYAVIMCSSVVGTSDIRSILEILVHSNLFAIAGFSFFGNAMLSMNTDKSWWTVAMAFLILLGGGLYTAKLLVETPLSGALVAIWCMLSILVTSKVEAFVAH